MVVVPFLRNNPSAVMFFQRFIFPALRTAIEWDYGILPSSSIKGLPTDKNVQILKFKFYENFEIVNFKKK
jgi:hypothetical protein